MIVTGVIRGEELDRVSGEGADYEAAKAQMLSCVPEGYALLAIYAGEHYPEGLASA